MTSVDKVKSICRERKLPISRLEKDLGYANGYIGQLRKGTFPNDRLVEIAKYLNVATAYLLGEDTENAPTTEDERSIGDLIDEVDIAFYGDYRELDNDDKETIRAMVQVMHARRTKKQEQESVRSF